MQLLELYQLIELIYASHLLSIRITLFLVPISCWKEQTTSFSVENPRYSCLNFMIMAMMVVMICRTIISQTSWQAKTFSMPRTKSLQSSWRKKQTVWSQQNSKKKMPQFDHFPCPGESDPYAEVEYIWDFYCNVCKAGHPLVTVICQ